MMEFTKKKQQLTMKMLKKRKKKKMRKSSKSIDINYMPYNQLKVILLLFLLRKKRTKNYHLDRLHI